MKAIVTTTINPPTPALLKFIEIGRRDDWLVIIVGDKKTPHAEYESLERANKHVMYLSPAEQETEFPLLSPLIGWNCIQRRNFGLLRAWGLGAEIVATVDDDNIPYEEWGRNLLVGTEVEMPVYESPETAAVFDPLAPFGTPYWHRGFPIELLPTRDRFRLAFKRKVKVLVQADLWNGNPDIDAIARISFNPTDEIFRDYHIDGEPRVPFSADRPMPFNSQNTFLHRSVLRDYFLFPHAGRMDDIFAAYWLQSQHPGCVAFSGASVFQDRNAHDLYTDLAAEMIGYKYALQVATDPDVLHDILPEDSLRAWVIYRGIMAA